MMSARIRTEPSFFASDPEVLFEGTYDPGGFSGNANYDVSLDRERFLMVQPTGSGRGAASEFFVAINWLEELGAKCLSESRAIRASGTRCRCDISLRRLVETRSPSIKGVASAI